MRIDFTLLLTILFIGLKLGGLIDWGWWWVLSPLWLSFLVVFLLVVFLEIVKCIRHAR